MEILKQAQEIVNAAFNDSEDRAKEMQEVQKTIDHANGCGCRSCVTASYERFSQLYEKWMVPDEELIDPAIWRKSPVIPEKGTYPDEDDFNQHAYSG